ncbi:MAG: hypothetical protein ABR543_11395 [Gemmatimonadaceae bacterium]
MASIKDAQTDGEKEALRHAILRLNARAWGVATGLLFGGGLFVATNFLVIKGGPNVGEHLQLLAAYFPGYRVTFLGSLIGFVYAFVVGYALGRLIGTVYNRVASP